MKPTIKPNLRLLIIGCIILIIGYIVLKKLSNKEEQFYDDPNIVEAYIHKNHKRMQKWWAWRQIYKQPNWTDKSAKWRGMTNEELNTNWGLPGAYVPGQWDHEYIKVLYNKQNRTIVGHADIAVDKNSATNPVLSCAANPPSVQGVTGKTGCDGARHFLRGGWASSRSGTVEEEITDSLGMTTVVSLRIENVNLMSLLLQQQLQQQEPQQQLQQQEPQQQLQQQEPQQQLQPQR